ncbi:MAG: TlpA disulfide reductase family protein [Ferruginibacter sp.]
MKKLLPFIICILSIGSAKAQGYDIILQTNYRAGMTYLTYYLGKDYFLQDSAVVSNKGLAVFKGDKKLPGGIYALVFPGKRLTADFLVDKEQKISIKADSNQLDKMQVTGSPANTLFKDYRAFVNLKGKQLQQERMAYNASRTHADSVLHEAAYKQYSKELNTYRENIINNKPGSMMAVLLNAMKDPPYPAKAAVTHDDSIANYNFYKSRYWDGISFLDERVIRTPFFLPKLETYYRQVMSQSTDSLVRDIDYRLLLARSSPEMFKYLLNWFTDEYISPKYMGQDAIFVHLFEKYHSRGVSSWLNEKQQETVTRRAYMLMSNLIGEKAANLDFIDGTGKPSALYDLKADYTVLVFWDPSCGHCKEEVPKIDSIYRASWKQKNVKIYAVLSEKEKQKADWLKYINEHGIRDWTNVYQPDAAADAEVKEKRPSYRQLYDITLTPTLYLLDKDKHIIAKKLNREQINDFLKVKFKQDKN